MHNHHAFTLDPSKLRELLKAELQDALVRRYGPPYRLLAHMARQVGCERATISDLFASNGSMPTRTITRFCDSLATTKEMRTRWETTSQLMEWARGYQTRKAEATKRMRRISQQKELPLWSRWVSGRLTELEWSLTDLSRTLGHKSALHGGKRGGNATNSIPGILKGAIVPRDFHKIERVLGQAPPDVRRAVRIARRTKYAASGRKGIQSTKRSRSRWTKKRLMDELNRMLPGDIPRNLVTRLARLRWDKPVGVEGYYIYASGVGARARIRGGEALRRATGQPKTTTPRLRLAHHLLHLERGSCELSQCPGCLELQIQARSNPKSRCRACWRDFMKSPAYSQWASERWIARKAGKDVPPLPPAPKRSGRRSDSERLRRYLIIYLRYALGRLDSGERLDHKDELDQARHLLSSTRNLRARKIYSLAEELLVPRASSPQG